MYTYLVSFKETITSGTFKGYSIYKEFKTTEDALEIHLTAFKKRPECTEIKITKI